MKKIVIFAIFCLFFYYTQAHSISKNGARMRCFKKKRDGTASTPSTPDNNNGFDGVWVSCKSLVTDLSASDVEKEEKRKRREYKKSKKSRKSKEENTPETNDDDASINSDDEDTSNTASFNYIDHLVIPKGTILNDNEECVTAIYNVNRLVKEITNSSIFEQSCDVDLDIDAFTKGLDSIKDELSQQMNDAIGKCGNSKIWNGAKLHQACRILSKTGQTVCHSIVDDAYEKYDSKCLEDATLSDMWEFSTWLWNQLIVVNSGCYLKQLYNYKCHPQKDAIVHMGANTYSLRLICESSNNSCEWPGTYTGTNEHVKCLSKSIEKNRNIAINVLKKNGYVCEGSTDLPQTLPSLEDENSSSSEEDIPYADETPYVINKDANEVNNNNPANDLNTDPNKKSYLVSSGTEPWTNTNQIIGTIFIIIFALLF